MAHARSNSPTEAEVGIVGAGPIGLELAAALVRAGVDYLHFEAGQIGQTIFGWPPHTHFFSSPERVAIAGIPIHNVDQTKLTAEAYLAYLRGVVEQLDLKVKTYEKVVGVEPDGEAFTIRTQRQTGPGTYRCRRVVLATGGLSAARELGIPGENLPHVSHYVGDPHRYFRTRLLIVGGRNSALEAALRCWRAGAEVTLSYRRPDFGEMAKRHLTAELGSLIREGEIAFHPATVPVEITPAHVVLAPADSENPAGVGRIVCPADFVLLCTGFVADMSLFEAAGATLGGTGQEPSYCAQTMETDVPGLYVLGTAAAGTQDRYRIFIENCHAHVVKIATELTGEPPERIGTDKWLRSVPES